MCCAVVAVNANARGGEVGDIMRACVCVCCGGRQREREREIGKWGLLCVHAVVAVDVNMREVGRWGCSACVLWWPST